MILAQWLGFRQRLNMNLCFNSGIVNFVLITDDEKDRRPYFIIFLFGYFFVYMTQPQTFGWILNTPPIVKLL